MERCSFDRGKQLVLSGALEIPAKSNPAQIRIHEHSAIAVVPGHSQQSRLTRAVVLQSRAQRLDVRASSSRNCVEDIANRRETGLDSRAIRMHAPLHYSANSRYQIHRWSDSDNAGRSPNHVDHVVGAATGTDRIPVGVECTNGDRNPRLQSKFFRPERRELTRNLLGSGELAVEFLTHPSEQNIDLGEKRLRRQASEIGIPQPFVAHGADTAFYLFWIGDSAQSGGYHIAVFKCRSEVCALCRIVAKPMQQLGNTPLRGVHTTALLDGFQLLAMGGFRDFRGLAFSTMVAPQVVLAERLQVFVDGNDGRSGGIESNRLDLVPGNTGLLYGLTRGLGQSTHVIFMGLGRVLGILPFAMEWIIDDGRSQQAAFAIDDRNAHTQGSEINTRHDRHWNDLPRTSARAQSRPSNRLLQPETS